MIFLADFPSSDLLKALQTHAGDLYARRGLMSTEAKPKNAKGEKLPSMIQAFDGSALVALGPYDVTIQESITFYIS